MGCRVRVCVECRVLWEADVKEVSGCEGVCGRKWMSG